MSIYTNITSNKWKSYLIMSLFVGLIVLAGYIYGQANNMGVSVALFAFIFATITSIGSYYFSDSIVLAMSQAHPADPKRDFDFYTVAENMAIAAGIPLPKLYVIEDSAPNAFATGRDPKHAVVCATRGLLDKLNRSELEGVIAHEMSHITNYDVLLMSIVTVLAGTIVFLADMFNRSLWFGRSRDNDRDNSGRQIFLILGIIFAILSPIIASIIQFSISRKREFLADASGALLTRNPEALARALEKISGDKEVLEAATNATAHLYIVNPFKGKNFGAWFAGLFDTHPPLEERIKILRSM